MNTDLLLYMVVAYFLFVIIYSIHHIYSSSKILPEIVKQKYKFNVRAKAMFISATHWKHEFKDDDLNYFVEFNKNYRGYLLRLLISLVVFNIIFMSYLYSTI